MWPGSGLITILIYAVFGSGGGSGPTNAFLLMDSTNFLLEDGSDFLLMN